MQKQDYTFGANIIENLTTGMYRDSKVIYRECIQNSCDQIDEAVASGLLGEGKGKIEIWLDLEKRIISIADNATGIPAADFVRKLGNIADSDKSIGDDKGFRGIGRLCMLAYCRELVFTTSAQGEKTVSTMRCDAAKMRQLINENYRGKKHTANSVLSAICNFDTDETTDKDSHFFKVEMIGINGENTELLDAKAIRDYLSFVVPVPYQNTFSYRSEIYKHAHQLGTKIDEYDITLDGEQIFKKYVTFLNSPSGEKYDDIFDVEFKDFCDENGELFAWMWIGLTQFNKAIPKVNLMRGLRLRKENIQIGGEDSLQKLFKEDRGNSYFVGEVFAVSKDLIPNSQRDYFNENPQRAFFENTLRQYFEDELHKVYYDGSKVNSAITKIDTYYIKVAEFKAGEKKGLFLNAEDRENKLEKVEEAKKQAESAKVILDKTKKKSDGIMKRVVERIEKERDSKPLVPIPKVNDSKQRISNRWSKYNRNERKLIEKICRIIRSATDSETAEKIIGKITEELSRGKNS